MHVQTVVARYRPAVPSIVLHHQTLEKYNTLACVPYQKAGISANQCADITFGNKLCPGTYTMLLASPLVRAATENAYFCCRVHMQVFFRHRARRGVPGNKATTLFDCLVSGCYSELALFGFLQFI